MSLLYFRWVRDSQSGMWVFRRIILADMNLQSNGMAFSEEIKIEALKNRRIRFREISIQYSSRLGEVKLKPLARRPVQPLVPGRKTICQAAKKMIV